MLYYSFPIVIVLFHFLSLKTCNSGAIVTDKTEAKDFIYVANFMNLY